MSKPYEGVKVLDLTHDLGRYVGRLFADLGADVIKCEPPEGALDRRAADLTISPEFAAEFEYFNASKRSEVFDLSSDQGQHAFMAQAQSAQVILLEKDGFAFSQFDALRAACPASVVAVVSPFGLEGPAADAKASDLVLQAAGGIAWLSGRVGEPPLRLPGGQATMITGVYAAAAVSLALADTLRTNNGHFVEVAAQECIAHSLQNSIQVWDFEKKVSMRGGEGTRDASEDIFACKDGFVFLAAPRTLGVSWNALVAWIRETGHPAAIELDRECWADRVWRLTAQAKALLRETLEPFFKLYTKDELTEQAIARKVVMAPVNSMKDVLADPQLGFRNYFRNALPVGPAGTMVRFPGAPYRLSAPVWEVKAAPALASYKPSLELQEQ